MTEQVRVDWQDRLCTLTLHRPEKANSLTEDMLRALVGAVETASSRANVMILTGAGKVFSAGADLDAARAGLTKSGLWEDLSGAIAAAPCLTIAALNGTVAGGAFGMVLACDLRVSVEGASFFYPVMKLGFLPQVSDPVRLAELVGPARAKMILIAGRKVAAREAQTWGLVDCVVEADRLLQTAAELAQDAIAAEPGHVKAIKTMFGPTHGKSP